MAAAGGEREWRERRSGEAALVAVSRALREATVGRSTSSKMSLQYSAVLMKDL